MAIRTELRTLAKARLKDAQILFAATRYDIGMLDAVKQLLTIL